MLIQVNGEDKEVPEGCRIPQLLEHLKLDSTVVAIEINKRTVMRSDHVITKLHEGDKVEIVTLVGGG